MRPKDNERYSDRAERFLPHQEYPIEIAFKFDDGKISVMGFLTNISKSGFQCLCLGLAPKKGTMVENLSFKHGQDLHRIASAKVERSDIINTLGMPDQCYLVGLSFERNEEPLLKTLESYLVSMPYVTHELKKIQLDPDENYRESGDSSSLFDKYFSGSTKNMFSKCRDLSGSLDSLKKNGHYQHMWRVTLTSALDNHITIFNPIKRCEQKALCFDSNSYLGLHTHPKVIEATKKTLNKFGSGSPSSQLLSGTHRYLRELEETTSKFHSRDETLIFTSRLSAILGVLRGLLRKNDSLLIDESSHGAIQECHKFVDSTVREFRHGSPKQLNDVLIQQEIASPSGDKLVAADGVSEINGAETALPAIAALCKKHNAKLLLDESHSIGVMGASGKGIEEKFSLIGTADIIVGSFCTAAGALGGYVAAEKEVIQYLRFYARPGLFDATLPAHICAGVIEAFKLIKTEPEHRERLWNNIHYLTPKLKDAGFNLSNKKESHILSIQIGEEQLLCAVSKDLFQEGIRCGMALYPMAGRKESSLRLTLNSKHSEKDLTKCFDVLYSLGKKYNLININKGSGRPPVR